MLFLHLAIGVLGGYLYWKTAESLEAFRDRVDPQKIRGGGVVLLPVMLWYLWRFTSRWAEVMTFLVLGFAVMGIVDDYRGISGRVKAVITLLASVVLLWGMGWVVPVRFVNFDVYVPVITEVFWMAFFVGFVNAFNVIDGKDGVLLTTSTVLLTYLYLLTANVMYLHVAAVGVGLLLWNSPPARLIMGDVGSYLLGLFITASFLLLAEVPIVAKLTALSFPLVDTLTTIHRRLSKGVSIFQSDTQHIHHVLCDRLGDRWGLFVVLLVNLLSVSLSYAYLTLGLVILPLIALWWAVLFSIPVVLRAKGLHA